jgi:UDP-N-acetylmuramoyl-tripeptide--D-alanyl-D-alanine ligase
MISTAELEQSLAPLLQSGSRGATTDFRRVATDSRMVEPGDLFVALQGEHEDGHTFVGDALERGARGLIVGCPADEAPPDVAVFVVADTLAALQRLAASHRDGKRARVLGITGSVGKTTTKEVTAAVLGARYRVLKNEANYNNEIGLPLTLLELNDRHQRAVLEMGMYALGEIRLLCEIARPHVGIVTNVGPSHLERLGSLEAIAAAKAELVESLPPDGIAILNGDDPVVASMSAKTKATVLTYGMSPACDVRGVEIESRGLEGISFTLEHAGGAIGVRTGLPGRHTVHNALAAAAAGLTDGMSMGEVADALAEARVPLRLQVHRGRNGATIVDDTYNASPSSMMAALDLLAELPGRRIVLLGDMRELGMLEEEGHRAVGRRAGEIAALVYTIGDLGRLIAEEAKRGGRATVRHWPSKEKAAADLRDRLTAEDVVLLKASRAMELETVLPTLKD